jgi:hypothetical protein
MGGRPITIGIRIRDGPQGEIYIWKNISFVGESPAGDSALFDLAKGNPTPNDTAFKWP